MSDLKIAVRATPFGEVLGLYRAVEVELPQLTSTSVAVDFVLVVDCSGSMRDQIVAVKLGLGKLFGAYEALATADVTLSLISYSSHGDCTAHFKHVPMSQAVGDEHVAREVLLLAARGLTGMSQAVACAAGLARPGRTLYVALMSDGYCNDPGVRVEQEGTLSRVADIVEDGGVVSTISYGEYADFAFLTRVAHVGGGVCHRAGNAAEFYRAVEAGARVATNRRAEATIISAAGASFVVLLEADGTSQAALRGTDMVLYNRPSARAMVWRYYALGVNGPLEQARKEPLQFNALVSLVAARGLLNCGEVDTAKEFVVGSRSAIVRKHWRAISSSEQADLAGDVDQVLTRLGDIELDDDLAVLPSGPSILDFLAVVDQFPPGTFQVHRESLQEQYKRRTVGRVNGRRLDDGSVEAFRCALVPEKLEWLDVTGVVLAGTQANASIQTEVPAHLMENGAEIVSVGGGELKLRGKLRSVQNYTIVGDGAVVTPVVSFKVNDRRARVALDELVMASGPVDESTWVVAVDFSKMAVVVEQPKVGLNFTKVAFERVLRAAAFSRLLAAMTPKVASAAYDEKTVTALREVGLTASLNFSPPTVSPYADVNQALSDGLLDTRVTYEVYVGTLELPLFTKDLYSGNEFLARRFTATLDGVRVDKPVGVNLLDGATFGVKELSKRVKLNAADDAAFAVNCGVLGVAESNAFATLQDALLFTYEDHAAAIVKASQVMAKLDVIRLGHGPIATRLGWIAEIRGDVDAAIARFWRKNISPVVMYAGALGALPSSVQAKRITAADLQGSVPASVKAEGAFYLTAGGLVITIVAEQVLFPTGRLTSGVSNTPTT